MTGWRPRLVPLGVALAAAVPIVALVFVSGFTHEQADGNLAWGSPMWITVGQ